MAKKTGKEAEERYETPFTAVTVFDRYLELIFANDQLWDRFQLYVRSSLPCRGAEYFEYHRDPECIDTWRAMLDNMGGGFPISLFAAASFEILAYERQGHDLEKSLRYAKAKITRQRNRKKLEDYEYAKKKYGAD